MPAITFVINEAIEGQGSRHYYVYAQPPPSACAQCNEHKLNGDLYRSPKRFNETEGRVAENVCYHCARSLVANWHRLRT